MTGYYQGTLEHDFGAWVQDNPYAIAVVLILCVLAVLVSPRT